MATALRRRASARPMLLLLLLVPLIGLVTPLYNRLDPRLFGVPFFYWFQLAMLAVGALVTAMIAAMSERQVDVESAEEYWAQRSAGEYDEYAEFGEYGEYAEYGGHPDEHGQYGDGEHGGTGAGEGLWRR